jgi:hypothetical protein
LSIGEKIDESAENYLNTIFRLLGKEGWWIPLKIWKSWIRSEWDSILIWNDQDSIFYFTNQDAKWSDNTLSCDTVSVILRVPVFFRYIDLIWNSKVVFKKKFYHNIFMLDFEPPVPW